MYFSRLNINMGRARAIHGAIKSGLVIVNLFSHLQHYSNVNYLEYDLYRNNDLIGKHKYEFIKNGDNLSVKSVVEFKITKLGIDLYKYFAESTENYEKNNFKSFKSTTIQNKKSNRCGAYCYMFIEAMKNNISYIDFIQLFKNNGSLSNDKILMRYVL